MGTMYQLLALDLDGTLLPYGQSAVSGQALTLIRRLQARGVLFCPASGRQYSSLRRLFHPAADRLYYVCENGAVVFGPGNPGPLLAKTAMDRRLAEELCRDILAVDQCEVLVSGVDTSYLCPKCPDVVDHVRYFVGNRVALSSRPEDIPEDMVKVSAYCRRGSAEAEPVLAPPVAEDLAGGGGGREVAGLYRGGQGKGGAGPVQGSGDRAGAGAGSGGQLQRRAHAGAGGRALDYGEGQTRSFCAASPGTVPGWRVCWSRSGSGWRAEREVPAPYGKSRAPCARLNIPERRRGAPPCGQSEIFFKS